MNRRPATLRQPSAAHVAGACLRVGAHALQVVLD